MSEAKVNILLVDDAPDGLVAMEAALADLGQNCVKARSGKEALKWLLDNECAVILLDVRMPVMDGFETAALIREREKSLRTPIILITGADPEEIHTSRAYTLGAVDYLLKPIVPQIVRSKVEAFVSLFNEKRELERESERLATERRELAEFVESIRSGQVDAIVRTGGGESKILRLLDEKVVEENERLVQELSRTNAELKRASRAKDEFLAKMSHELRTPLNSIIGFTDMMIHDGNDPPVGKRANRLEKVHRNAQNLSALINDILDISRIEADQITLRRETADVGTLIAECVDSAERLVKGDTVELRTRLDRSVSSRPNCVGDAVRLRQIIMNLLSNAAKFTEQGHIELRASLEGDCLVIEVDDTGIGIPAEHLAHVFDEFYQVDSSSTRRAGGAGLGLTNCRNLCRLMGGDVTVTSKPQSGSCFTVRIPIERADLVPGDARDACSRPALQASEQRAGSM